MCKRQQSMLKSRKSTYQKKIFEDNLAIALGVYLRQRRNELRFTRSEIENLTGISSSYLSGVESGTRDISLSVLYKLVKVLNFDVTDLLAKAEQRRKVLSRQQLLRLRKNVLKKRWAKKTIDKKPITFPETRFLVKPSDADLLEQIISTLAQKWTIAILIQLCTGRHRTGELMDALHPISAKTLSERLKTLHHQGFVKRKAYDVVPPRVEYQLTNDGRKLLSVLPDIKHASSKMPPEEIHSWGNSDVR